MTDVDQKDTSLPVKIQPLNFWQLWMIIRIVVKCTREVKDYSPLKFKGSNENK